uniref:Myc-like regulatory protein n=1 Tax=Lotus uliginosus TaxID=181288 RepID=Q8LRU0_9FABA|nr:myc-like regulatory protein [Lotus uliginosus]
MQQKNLSAQLAVAVRSIQWSYGIFWAPSTTQQRELEWRDGFYNGDIKTMKTVQTMETKADKIGLQRSEQLRELYRFLLEGEADPQAKRPSASLSPEDLSDSEWYYLVCMSFVFYPNQSLPGKALEIGETVWLCNAQQADSKFFSRSLLAKSASIQTVVCFPYLGGVIEIGTTEVVSEDPNLIQHVKTCFLEVSKPTCSDKSSSAHDKPHDDNKYPTCTKGDHEVFDKMPLENSCSFAEELKFDEYPGRELQDDDNNEDCDMDGFSDGGYDHYESMIEGINEGGSSQVHFVNDGGEINGAPDSLSSCDCMSEAFDNHGKKDSKNVTQIQQRELLDCDDHSKSSSLDIGADEDLYYTKTLCAILGNSSSFAQNLCASKSSFVKWKKGGVSERKRPWLQQMMLKKTLFDVPFMHLSCSSLKLQKENGRKEWTSKLENADNFMGNVFSDKKRESRNIQVLKSVAPSACEVEKISVLGGTIKYLKNLEARVEELESYMDTTATGARTKRKCPDVLEQISDNYGPSNIYMGMKKPMINKRKACDIDNIDTGLDIIVSEEDKPLDVKVNMKEEEVLIEMKCPYREYILYDIMDAINNLHIDAHTVDSSTADGVLTFKLKSKFRGAATAPVRMIKEALWKVSGKI